MHSKLAFYFFCRNKWVKLLLNHIYFLPCGMAVMSPFKGIPGGLFCNAFLLLVVLYSYKTSWLQRRTSYRHEYKPKNQTSSRNNVILFSSHSRLWIISLPLSELCLMFQMRRLTPMPLLNYKNAFSHAVKSIVMLNNRSPQSFVQMWGL